MKKVINKICKGILLTALFVMCMPQVAQATQQSGSVAASNIEDVTDTGLSIDIETEESTYKAGEGTIHWKPAVVDAGGKVTGPAVLTLNNATITAAEGPCIEIYYGTDIIVEVIGKNQMSCTDGETINISSDDEITVTIKGNGTLDMGNDNLIGGLKTNVNMCITGGVTVLALKSNIAANDLTVENANVTCKFLLLMGELHVKSGAINTDQGYVGCEGGDAIVDKGATLNAGFLGLYGDLQNAGEVNAIASTDEDMSARLIYGNVTFNRALFDYISSTTPVKITEGSTLTIPKGTTVNWSKLELTFEGDGTLVVEGGVKLPENTTPEDIEKMNITGDGVVIVKGGNDTEDVIYSTSGSEMNVVTGLDFTNVGTGKGQTAATGNGYVWDAATKTLTLSGAYIDGVLNLPTGSNIIVSGVNIVTENVTVAGEVSDDFTLSGEGRLNAYSKKYVSHIYGEPVFTWTETKDGYTAKAAFVCQGGEDTQVVDAKVTTLSKKNSTCKEQGMLTCTAKVTFEGKDYTETKKFALAKAEHTWDKGTVTKHTTNKTKGEITYKCTVCKEKKVETINVLKVGMLIKDSKAVYKVTKVSGKGGTVEYVKPAKKTVKTVSIPATIKANGRTYKVTGIAAKACKGYKKLVSVTIGKNVKSIGKQAFYNCKKLKNITIKTKSLKTNKIGKNAFKGIKSTVTIKVPKKKYGSYKSMLRKRGVSKKAKFKKI